jgi:choline kinase
MSDYHDPERPHHIRENRYPTKEQQLNLVQGYVEHGVENFDDEEKIDNEVAQLLQQAKQWRPAIHAYWCIWGIVQAVVEPSTDIKMREEKDMEKGQYRFEHETDGSREEADVDEEDDYFDYVSYSTEKAQLFWTDLVTLGLIKQDDYHGTIKRIED